MKAFQFKEYGSASDVLAEVDLPLPKAEGVDLLVRVIAASQNPVDHKVVAGAIPNEEHQKGFTPGWDAAGVVEAAGPDVQGFSVGDKVYFAGSLLRHGTLATHTLVDHRIAALKPESLTFAEAAAIPLTWITTYEGFVEQLGLTAPTTDEERAAAAKKTALVVNGAGGVGSLAIQLLKQHLGVRVVATASRDETAAWCRQLGADEIINHREKLQPQLAALGIQGVDYVGNHVDYNTNYDEVVEVLAPRGGVYFITGGGPVDLSKLMLKSCRVAYELMFTRAIFQHDPAAQGRALAVAAELIDAGKVRTTLNKRVPFTLEGILEAFAVQESGKAIGKTVIVRDGADDK